MKKLILLALLLAACSRVEISQHEVSQCFEIELISAWEGTFGEKRWDVIGDFNGMMLRIHLFYEPDFNDIACTNPGEFWGTLVEVDGE